MQFHNLDITPDNNIYQDLSVGHCDILCQSASPKLEFFKNHIFQNQQSQLARMRQLKGKVKENAKEKKERKKEFAENREKAFSVGN